MGFKKAISFHNLESLVYQLLNLRIFGVLFQNFTRKGGEGAKNALNALRYAAGITINLCCINNLEFRVKFCFLPLFMVYVQDMIKQGF